jgi:uncharacterized membrane protein SpoIIM required for sporulation
MRETKFIQDNRKNWETFESMVGKKDTDPDQLSQLFVQITEDLSYARTNYPHRSVKVYLNSLAQRVFAGLHNQKQTRKGGNFVKFWTDELPDLLWEARKEFLLSFVVFLIGVLIGVLSTRSDAGFSELILSPSYVETTMENIQKGDPMAVYKSGGKFGDTLGIALNNLKVSLLIFLFGALFSVGSVGILLGNGIMVGVFQYLFVPPGVFQESFFTIWMHGTPEMFAMVVAGVAGLTMGKGLLLPGTYNRIQAFQRSARRGIKIFLGVAPVTIYAAVIEGYITRHTEIPDLYRGLFIFINLALLLLYFVGYPYWRASKGFAQPVPDLKLPPSRPYNIVFNQIKTAGEIFGDSLVLFLRQIGTNIMMVLGLSIAVGVILFFLLPPGTEALMEFGKNLGDGLQNISNLLIHPQEFSISVVQLLPIGVSAIVSLGFLSRLSDQEIWPNYYAIRKRKFSWILLGTSGMLLSLYLGSLANSLLVFKLLMEYTLMVTYLHYMSPPFETLSYSLALPFRYIVKWISLSALTSFVFYMLFLLTTTGVLGAIIDFFLMNVPGTGEEKRRGSLFLFVVAYQAVLNIGYIGFSAMSALLIHSIIETDKAPALRKEIMAFGKDQKFRGLEREQQKLVD